MPERLVIFLNRGGYEPAFSAASLGVTAAAMGDSVTWVMGFAALRAMARHELGTAENEEEVQSEKRAKDVGAASPERMFQEAKALGAQLWACDTTFRLAGVTRESLVPALDQLVGLPSIWALARSAKTLSF